MTLRGRPVGLSHGYVFFEIRSDILKGSLRFNQSQLEAEDNEQISIADDHYCSSSAAQQVPWLPGQDRPPWGRSPQEGESPGTAHGGVPHTAVQGVDSGRCHPLWTAAPLGQRTACTPVSSSFSTGFRRR